MQKKKRKNWSVLCALSLRFILFVIQIGRIVLSLFAFIATTTSEGG